ncbi:MULTISPECIES: hypothetical protein [Bacillus cereus group]|uniref:hypothetical protein n=1 Tax=Bacillus cereus group TaxID=86661 RepID=UPI0009942523|nr:MULTISPECIES: hypothetical protein [Bacillus cereus group]OOR20909.1 hypothetical protein BW891_03210 [Bacillus mycoides]QWG80464.1 hypothetical protein EXW27_23860 [Bacillus mycoides]TXR88554.1 hypothetical protein DN408_07430 [Bacillus sp. AR13-1]
MKVNLMEILPDLAEYDMKSVIEIHKYGWDMEIAKLEKTYQYVEELVNARRKMCSVAVHSDPGGSTMHLLDELSLATMLIQPTYYKSVFVTIYSTLEATLKNLASAIETEVKVEKSLEDLRQHNGIRKYINFLMHNGIQENLIKDKSWNELLKWQDLRNCISHNGSVPKNDEMKTTLAQIGFYIDRETPQVMFHPEDVERFIHLVKVYMENVYNLCQKTFNLIIK